MTTIIDGPAAGARLMLRRAPVFLRVTKSLDVFDAINELGDTPRPDEKLFAYVMMEPPAHCHIRAGRGASGFYVIAAYRYIKEQPADAVMRDQKAWERWVSDQPWPEWLKKKKPIFFQKSVDVPPPEEDNRANV